MSAIQLALESADPARSSRPVIVLLSDGDDPARDGEWRRGIDAAKAKGIRVHVVGIGDPLKAETIPVGKELLTFEDEPVRTKLDENVLREIARGTGGEYLPARATNRFPLGAVVQQILDAEALRDDSSDDSALPVYQLRFGWFLLPAVLLLMLTMLLSEGPGAASVKLKPAAAPTPKPKLAAVLLLLTALVGISAAYPPDAEMLLRLGNDAFDRQDYSAALDYYEKAAALTHDPGKISFNKAAAYYRLERFKEAIECYRRALEDDQAAPERRARAHYDLGNARASAMHRKGSTN